MFNSGHQFLNTAIVALLALFTMVFIVCRAVWGLSHPMGRLIPGIAGEAGYRFSRGLAQHEPGFPREQSFATRCLA
jgi:hypothetical protein